METATYFGAESGLTASYQADLGVKIDRALDRLGEGTYERWIEAAQEYEAAGFTIDVAMCKALNDVHGGDQWRRFRK
jgi:hypothetical protein